jgi:signal transduction histidine kinase
MGPDAMNPAKKKLQSAEISKDTRKSLGLESHHPDKLETLSALIKISTAIGFMPMKLKTSLQFLVEEIKRLFHAYGCAIFPLDKDANFDLIFSGPSHMKNRLQSCCMSRKKECRIIRDGLPFIAKNTRRIDRRCRGYEFDKTMKSYVCLPVSTGNKLIGILFVCSLRKNAFNQDHLEMMLSLTTLAAAEIQRTGLFQKLQEEKERVESANEVISKLNTDLKVKIEDLKKAQKQILQKEKLAVAGRLAAGIAHEINNPTGIIINRIECLQSEAKENHLPDHLIKDLLIINRYAQRISMIVKDLSILSRTTYTESNFTRINLNDILADAIFLMEQKIMGSKTKVFKTFSPDSLYIMGDPGKLEHVFINIIDNAIYAVSDGGSITVSSKSDKELVRVEISDSGTGILKEHIDKIYDPFYTTKEIGKGTGLGLPISHAIVMDHNAEICMDSQFNKGTTFTITFPMAPKLGNESL